MDINIVVIGREKIKAFGDISSNLETKFLASVVGWSGPTFILPKDLALIQSRYLGTWGLASARDSSKARCRASSSLCKGEKNPPVSLDFTQIYFYLSNLFLTHHSVLQSNHWRGCPAWKLGCGSMADKQTVVRDIKGLKGGEEKQVDLPAGRGRGR